MNHLPNNPDIPKASAIIAGLFGSAAAIFFGYMVGTDEALIIWALFLVVISGFVLLLLGSRYWMLVPIAAALSLPALPLAGRAFQLSEVIGAGVVGIYMARLAMKRERFRSFVPYDFPIIAFALWVLVIYYQNPVGLAILGSDTAGMREYVTLALSFLVYFVVCNQRAGEREVKWIVLLGLAGTCAGAAWSIVSMRMGMGADDDSFYSWHQSLSSPANAVVLFLFSRYRIKEIFSGRHPWMVPLLGICLLMSFYSGKRAVTMTLLLTPLVAGLLRKEFMFAAIYLFFAVIGIGFLAIGHGTFFELPKPTQRVLMNLPGKWDLDVVGMKGEEGETDGWRTALRKAATERIEANPIFGKGLGISSDLVFEAAARDAAGTTGADAGFYASQGSSWHSTWYGIAANFGLPALIPYAIFLFVFLQVAVRIYQAHPYGSWLHTYGFMTAAGWFGMALRSFTSGSGVAWAISLWPVFGVMMAVLHTTVIKEKKKVPMALPRHLQSV